MAATMKGRSDGRAIRGWPAKRVAALILTVALIGLGAYAWETGVRDKQALSLMCVGTVLGLLYTVRGGSLPAIVHWVFGDKLTADDGPRNLPARIYLPILLAVVVAAVAAYYFFGPRR
jgi:hypothetical protein